MIQMNVEKILKELSVSGVEVDHCDLGSAKGSGADVFVGTRDIAGELQQIGKPVISLTNMLDQDNLRTQLNEVLAKEGIL